MTNKDKIIQFLGKAKRGYDDDELSKILNISQDNKSTRYVEDLKNKVQLLEKKAKGKFVIS